MLEISKLPISTTPSTGVPRSASENNSPSNNQLTTTQQANQSPENARSPKTETQRQTSGTKRVQEDSNANKSSKESFSRTLERQLSQATSARPQNEMALAISSTTDQNAFEISDLLLLSKTSQPTSALQDTSGTEKSDNPSELLALMLQTPVTATPQNGNTIDDQNSEIDTGNHNTAHTAQQNTLANNLLPLSKQLDGEMRRPPANITDSTQTPNNKAAEFAAMIGAQEALSSNTGGQEQLKSEGSFEQMLSTLQNTHIKAHPTNPAPVSAAPPQAMNTPFKQTGWDNEVADKLVWMVGRQEQRAELVLNPPQLGRIEISLSVNNDQTNALLVSANPAVRETLESSLPRLREMLADAGISLGQAHVGADSRQNETSQSANNRENRDNSNRGSQTDPIALDNNTLRQMNTTTWTRQGTSLVDVFA